MKKILIYIISSFLMVSTVLYTAEPVLSERQKLIKHYTKIAEEKHKPYTTRGHLERAGYVGLAAGLASEAGLGYWIYKDTYCGPDAKLTLIYLATALSYFLAKSIAQSYFIVDAIASFTKQCTFEPILEWQLHKNH